MIANDAYVFADSYTNEIYSISKNGTIKNDGSFDNVYDAYQLIGATPSGIYAADKYNKSISIFDFNLNFMFKKELNLDSNLDLVRVDKRNNNLYIFSKKANIIFKTNINNDKVSPFINLNRFENLNHCINDIVFNNNGDVSLISCDNKMLNFSSLGKYNGISIFNSPDIKFIVELEKSWYGFNIEGYGESFINDNSITLPGITSQILDIKSKNNKISVLLENRIIIFNVLSK